MSTTTPAEKHEGPTAWVRSIIAWFLLFAISAVIIVTIVIPLVAGAERFTVLTGSMSPTYPAGTLIVVKPVDVDSLSVGTVITYQLESGKNAVVTHRIVGVSEDTLGERAFITQGDANNAPDKAAVMPVQVRGKVWYSVPYLGYVNSWLTGSQRGLFLAVAITGLLGYAAIMFATAARDSIRKRREQEEIDDVSEQ